MPEDYFPLVRRKTAITVCRQRRHSWNIWMVTLQLEQLVVEGTTLTGEDMDMVRRNAMRGLLKCMD